MSRWWKKIGDIVSGNIMTGSPEAEMPKWKSKVVPLVEDDNDEEIRKYLSADKLKKFYRDHFRWTDNQHRYKRY